MTPHENNPKPKAVQQLSCTFIRVGFLKLIYPAGMYGTDSLSSTEFTLNNEHSLSIYLVLTNFENCIMKLSNQKLVFYLISPQPQAKFLNLSNYFCDLQILVLAFSNSYQQKAGGKTQGLERNSPVFHKRNYCRSVLGHTGFPSQWYIEISCWS